MTLRSSAKLGLFLAATSVFAAGCVKPKSPPPVTSAAQSNRVVAQGQILPEDGFVRLASAPGDIVDIIVEGVELGADVANGQELIIMRSAALRQKQLAALEAQKKAAVQEAEQAVGQANRQVRIAKAKRQSILSKQESLNKQNDLLKLAEAQLAASNQVLQKLTNISTNSLTKEFIGELEIDRQRIEVGEAELKVEEQREKFRLAKEDLQFALEAADIELEVAEEVLAAAKKVSPVDVVDAQIDTLLQEVESSRIIAPRTGKIVAFNAKPGQASIPQIPLLEIADLTNLVVEVEINERDAANVRENQPAKITSRAFSETIEGVVVKVHRMVGRPQLKQLDPLARADYRTKTAVVRLNDSSVAENWLQLQVQVEIDTSGAASKASDKE